MCVCAPPRADVVVVVCVCVCVRVCCVPPHAFGLPVESLRLVAYFGRTRPSSLHGSALVRAAGTRSQVRSNSSCSSCSRARALTWAVAPQNRRVSAVLTAGSLYNPVEGADKCLSEPLCTMYLVEAEGISYTIGYHSEIEKVER